LNRLFQKNRAKTVILLIFTIQIITMGCQKPPIQRAIGLMNQGRWEEAVDLLRPEIESNPADPDLNEVYGTALLRNGQPSLAVWPLRRSYLAEGDRSDSGAMLAEALVTGGASQEGLDLVTELIQAQPDDIYLLSLRKPQNRKIRGICQFSL
jgi:Flp pilus assembly protein TadD